MHAGEHGDATQEFGPAGAQGAAHVRDVVVGEAVADPVGDARGGLAHPGVPPVGAHAADHVVAAVHRRQQARDVRRIVLQVGVEGDHDAAAGEAEAGVEGRRLPRVAPLADHPRGRVLAGQLQQDAGAAVRAAVVHVDHLVGAAELAHGAVDLGRQEGEALLLVVDRDDDGNLGGGHDGVS